MKFFETIFLEDVDKFMQTLDVKSKEIRLLAFWDKTKKTKVLVIASNGFVKKTQKIPLKEIKRTEKIRKNYFEDSKK